MFKFITNLFSTKSKCLHRNKRGVCKIEGCTKNVSSMGRCKKCGVQIFKKNCIRHTITGKKREIINNKNTKISKINKLKELYGKECYYCKLPLTNKEVTIDHVVPLSRGGTSHISNLVISCKKCNVKKASKLI